LRDGEQSTTLLGDWYATTLPWRPQVALLVNEATLLPVLMPLAPAATMPARIADEVSAVLAAHGTPDAVFETEREQMRQWRIAPTANRSVTPSPPPPPGSPPDRGLPHRPPSCCSAHWQCGCC
jgi:hypothetical protein